MDVNGEILSVFQQSEEDGGNYVIVVGACQPHLSKSAETIQVGGNIGWAKASGLFYSSALTNGVQVPMSVDVKLRIKNPEFTGKSSTAKAARPSLTPEQLKLQTQAKIQAAIAAKKAA